MCLPFSRVNTPLLNSNSRFVLPVVLTATALLKSPDTSSRLTVCLPDTTLLPSRLAIPSYSGTILLISLICFNSSNLLSSKVLCSAFRTIDNDELEALYNVRSMLSLDTIIFKHTYIHARTTVKITKIISALYLRLVT